MRIATLGIVLPLLATPTLAAAQVDVRFEAYASIAPGEPVASVEVFYDQLSPYGMWVGEPRLGRVFLPDQRGYVPYTAGHWQYTDLGFVWISDEPFGWATSHYGRWAYSPVYDAWVWVPDTEWGPAWVDWRESDGMLGWAPLPPPGVVDVYAPPIAAWHYCPAHAILAVDLTRHYVPRDRVLVVQRRARPIEARATIGRTQVVVGPRPERLRELRVAVRPTRVEARAIGRMPPTEARAAAERARQRLPQIEERNRVRVEQNVRVRDIARQHERARPERPQPAPQRTQPQPPRPTPPERAKQTPPERAQPTERRPTPPEQRPQPPERAQPQQEHRPTPPERTQPPERAQPQPEHRPTPPERTQPPERAQPQRGEPPPKHEPPKKDDKRGHSD